MGREPLAERSCSVAPIQAPKSSRRHKLDQITIVDALAGSVAWGWPIPRTLQSMRNPPAYR
eukprot:1160154-Pelagomonas_calceolata.AAC.4